MLKNCIELYCWYYQKLSNDILCCAIDENQCDIDEEAEDVDDPYMTIPTPVAMPATRKKENFSEVSTLARKAFDGIEVMDRSPEGETNWIYIGYTRNI